MTNSLFILNDPPYGSGRSYNALRIALSLSKHASNYVRVFLVGDAIECAREHVKDDKPRYDTVTLLRALRHHGGEVCLCEICLETREEDRSEVLDGCHRCSLEELAGWMGQADRLLVF